MPNENSNVSSRLNLPEQPAADWIAERRKLLAKRIGRLLANKWLQQRRQSDKSQIGRGE